MNGNVRGALCGLGAAIVGFLVANNVVYGHFGIRPGDRSDLLALALIVAVFATVGFWLGRR